MLSTIPCSGFLYLQFLARCHPYILISFLMIFTLVEYVVKACSTVQCVVPAVAILDVRKKEVGSTCQNIF